MEMNRECKTCVYSEELKRSNGLYKCRKNPPLIDNDCVWKMGSWPSVKPYDWCGEYKRIESKQTLN